MDRSYLSKCLFALAAAMLTGGVLEAAAPRLTRVEPRGAQRGTEVEVVFRGDRLDDAAEILFYEGGLEVVSLEAKSPQELRCVVKIAEDCDLGTKRMRVRTKTGLSDLGTFRVGPYTEIKEVEPNNEFATPQEIPLNVTVNGTITNEDVDYFVVDAQKGQRITAEVEAIRLGDSLFDAYVAIFNAARFELSTSDDEALVYQDGIASIIAPEDGRYIIQVRESSFGNGNAYRLHVGTFPRPRAVVPAGAPAGSALKVAFHGDVAGSFEQEFQIPEEAVHEFGLVAQDEHGVAPSGIPFRISPLENVIEQEPNNDIATATPAKAPAAFNGLIGEPGDIDFFRFTAQRGQVLDIRVYARQLRSELDSVLVVYNDKGGAIANNDDSGGPDSYLRFNPPADGDFFVSIRDHLNRGGDAFHYRVELTPVSPKLELSVGEYARYQEHKLAVAQGNRLPILITATRRDFGGPLEFLGEDLPAGVAVEFAPVLPDQSVAQVLLIAEPEAPLAASLSQIVGRMAEAQVSPEQVAAAEAARAARAAERTGERREGGRRFGRGGGFRQRGPILPASGLTKQTVTTVRGQNQQPFFEEQVPALAVAVIEKVPFTIDLVEPKVPLVQNGVMQLLVKAQRDEGFTAPIKVDLLLNPNGVNSSREVSIPEGKDEALITINAAGNAQVREQVLCVRGTATVGNGPVMVATPFVKLNVSEPFVKLNFQQAAIEQGSESAMVVGVEVLREFEGEADVKLVGLPNKVTSPTLKLTKETKELIFPLNAEADAAQGITKNIICEITIVEHDEPVLHNLSGGTLRVDKPAPPKVDAPVVAKAPMPAENKPAAAAPPRPLSRLEQLRLEQKARLEAQNAAEAKDDKTGAE